MSYFNVRLRELRVTKNLYQRELAALAGIKLRSYQLYEQGKTEPSIDVLIKFADVLGVTLDYLVGRDLIEFENAMRAAGFEINPQESPSE